MLGEPEYTINDLFAQLGLDSSHEAIDKFIAEHPLDKNTSLTDADFWTESQRAFLKEEWKLDAAWVEIIDDLNVRLHPTA
uniref:DUF2789 domain-containing protein n=1 Tax=Psychrobacter sp. (strain PRwf-1) TaxID=349106 RepID=A5WGM1_PSYWF